MWLSEGKPTEGELFVNMRLSRKQFKYAVRRLKRCSDRIRNENLADSLFNDGGNIFQEVKKLRGGSKTFSSRIDDKVSPHDMADHFAYV